MIACDRRAVGRLTAAGCRSRHERRPAADCSGPMRPVPSGSVHSDADQGALVGIVMIRRY